MNSLETRTKIVVILNVKLGNHMRTTYVKNSKYHLIICVPFVNPLTSFGQQLLYNSNQLPYLTRSFPLVFFFVLPTNWFQPHGTISRDKKKTVGLSLSFARRVYLNRLSASATLHYISSLTTGQIKLVYLESFNIIG